MNDNNDNNDKLTQIYKNLLLELNLENHIDNIDESAKKASSLLKKWTASTHLKTPKLEPIPTINNNNWITIQNIHYYALCAHDFVPFFGEASIIYLPNQHIAGFGAFARLVNHLSHRPQFQEKLTTDIADHIQNDLNPKALLVLLTGRHMCLEMNDHGHNLTCTTQETKGLCLSNPKYLQHALTLLK